MWRYSADVNYASRFMLLLQPFEFLLGEFMGCLRRLLCRFPRGIVPAARACLVIHRVKIQDTYFLLKISTELADQKKTLMLGHEEESGKRHSRVPKQNFKALKLLTH
jgi:hypothetical protein